MLLSASLKMKSNEKTLGERKGPSSLKMGHDVTAYRNILGPAFTSSCQTIATFHFCCDMLNIAKHGTWQTSTTSYNIPKNSIKNRTIFKLDPTTPSYNTQHILTTPTLLYNVATGWLSERNMLRPTMLRYVALAGG